MRDDEDDEFDVVIETLQDRIDKLWRLTESKDEWGIMDHIRLEQIDQLKKAQRMWKENKQ